MRKLFAFTVVSALCWSWAISTANSQAPQVGAKLVVQIGKSPAAVKVIEDLIGNPGLVQKALSILGIRAQPELIAAETLRKLSDADRGALILVSVRRLLDSFESLGFDGPFLIRGGGPSVDGQEPGEI
jgi:hypothetical protein